MTANIHVEAYTHTYIHTYITIQICTQPNTHKYNFNAEISNIFSLCIITKPNLKLKSHLKLFGHHHSSSKLKIKIKDGSKKVIIRG